MEIGDYLKLVDKKENPFQRSTLSIKKYYQKLVDDILEGSLMPPISIISTTEINYIKKDISEGEKYFILDGLQRTNCLLDCLDKYGKGTVKKLACRKRCF